MIHVTEGAILAIFESRAAIAEETDVLRIKARSISAFDDESHPLDFVSQNEVEPDDLILDFPPGVRIVIDPKSAELLGGRVVDWDGWTLVVRVEPVVD